jgi:hypothetical protein
MIYGAASTERLFHFRRHYMVPLMRLRDSIRHRNAGEPPVPANRSPALLFEKFRDRQTDDRVERTATLTRERCADVGIESLARASTPVAGSLAGTGGNVLACQYAQGIQFGSDLEISI